MSYISQLQLNRDLSLLKTNFKDISMKVMTYDKQFKIYNKLHKEFENNIFQSQKDVRKDFDKSLSSMNEMLVDLITEVQSLRRDFDDLDIISRTVEDIENIKSEVRKELEDMVGVTKKNIEKSDNDKREKAKDVIDFLQSLDLEEDYSDIVIKLGCKTPEDLKLFTEKELIDEGFMLLHARKVLKT